jgi:hypothetical protein
VLHSRGIEGRRCEELSMTTVPADPMMAEVQFRIAELRRARSAPVTARRRRRRGGAWSAAAALRASFGASTPASARRQPCAAC